MVRPYHRMSDEEWVDILNDWLGWARTKVETGTNIGQFGFASKDEGFDTRFSSEVCTILQGLELIGHAPGFCKKFPRWWVAPDGEVTAEKLIAYRANR